jgi:hypothetical protein
MELVTCKISPIKRIIQNTFLSCGEWYDVCAPCCSIDGVKMAAANSTGGGQHHASLNLMACVRESSPQQEDLVSDVTDADFVRHGK